MTTKIRLSRAGRKKLAFYHILVTDSRSPRDSKFIEKLGYYNPLNGEQGSWHFDSDRVNHWLSSGAQPSDTLMRIFLKEGLGSEKQRQKWEKRYAGRKNAVQATIQAKRDAEAKEKAAEEAAAAAEASEAEGEQAAAE